MKFEAIGERHTIDAEAIRVDRLFPTPLATIVVPDHERLNAELRATILGHAADSAGVRLSNEGGWQSSANFLDWSGDAGGEIAAFGRAYANELSAIVVDGDLVHASLDWRTTIWANINLRGHANAIHGHPGAYWSGVYWVDDGRRVPGEEVGGDLVFSDPRGLAPTLFSPDLKMRIAGCLTAGLSHSVSAVSGTFAIFPSWLLHSVTRYEGHRERISIAFNFAP